MFRIPDVIIYGIIVMLIYLASNSTSEEIDISVPPEQFSGDLPGTSRFDPEILVTVDEAASGMGTAFAINKSGRWLTARHVVDSCNVTALRFGRFKVLPVNVQNSEKSDLAILTGKIKQTPIRSDLYSKRRIGEHGFFIGYPQGKSGEVIGRLLGRGNMKIRGRYRTDEGVLAWAELGRSRGLQGSLGGLSGGPVLDSDGEVIGVVSAESPRRGRIYTVAPKNMTDFIRENSKYEATDIDANNYGLRADEFRRNRQIVQVICIAS